MNKKQIRGRVCDSVDVTIYALVLSPSDVAAHQSQFYHCLIRLVVCILQRPAVFQLSYYVSVLYYS